ncbi:hypothetical protein F441_21513 [Phytophthora nicotianae CJ01A1]|uniref:Uncharacterized protein n=3 Tax=Phytophthora nicotianae TaxID=4792 RepID=W2HTR5_PHYNI|nr:hypothetical protein L915_21024 [Phytophthora nicotianae]ETL25226.1 hypothetical protein L916_20899 [Phytophthora nicotianae]ETM31715.1 hypothetical protein L914_20766 [Phytophthora nicotianae]ETO60119.1 hypothetical protein F444_21658 [Phytophthora nicotianae P1976]ETP01214.1 hypothetical protein F441_21513 [Phytophthora nicotianae CJ01A1]
MMDGTHFFEVMLDFVEQFSFDEAAAENLRIPPDNVPSQSQDESMSAAIPLSKRTNAHRKIPRTSEEKRRRRMEINERKKMLRKAGIYGDSNKVRNDRTREIAVLNQQILKLQLDWKLLQSQNTQNHCREKSENDAMIIGRSNTPLVSSVWKEQAVHQRRQREEAERDNVRLRLAVERQKKVANSLHSLLRKRASQLANECASLEDMCCHKPGTVA